MEFTKTQTSIIVLEIVAVFLGIISVIRFMKPAKALELSSGSIVSTAAVASVYIPPDTEIFKKIDKTGGVSESVTIDLDDAKKKPEKTTKIQGKKSTVKENRKSEVITIDLE